MPGSVAEALDGTACGSLDALFKSELQDSSGDAAYSGVNAQNTHSVDGNSPNPTKNVFRQTLNFLQLEGLSDQVAAKPISFSFSTTIRSVCSLRRSRRAKTTCRFGGPALQNYHPIVEFFVNYQTID